MDFYIMFPKEKTHLKTLTKLFFCSYYQSNRFHSSSALSQADPSQMCFSVSRLVENDHRLTSGMCAGLYCGPSFRRRQDKIIQDYSMPAFLDILSERQTSAHQREHNHKQTLWCLHCTDISYINQICFRSRLSFVFLSSRSEFTQCSFFYNFIRIPFCRFSIAPPALQTTYLKEQFSILNSVNLFPHFFLHLNA